MMVTAHAAGLVGCRTCGRVWPKGCAVCERCGARLDRSEALAVQRIWAWLIAGMILYVPANIYPMLRTATLTGSETNTIIGGVIALIKHHEWAIAAIVFTASVVVPIGKFIAISWLTLTLHNRSRQGTHRHHRLLALVEFIGRWSMMDVFVVAILSALVQLGYVATIHPGPAAASFALSVAFTMLSAQAFDPRLIWDGPEGTTQ
jgi:paraquat-inducible protein A